MNNEKKLLITGSNGLIGSEMVRYFHDLGWKIHGMDNNMRADFFGPQGDTRWNQQRLGARDWSKGQTDYCVHCIRSSGI